MAQGHRSVGFLFKGGAGNLSAGVGSSERLNYYGETVTLEMTEILSRL